MSKKEDLLARIRAGKKNVKIEHILKLMTSYGFTCKDTRHGYLFFHEKLKGIIMPHVSRPHGRENKVLVKYVDECLNAIEQLLELEK